MTLCSTYFQLINLFVKILVYACINFTGHNQYIPSTTFSFIIQDVVEMNIFITQM